MSLSDRLRAYILWPLAALIFLGYAVVLVPILPLRPTRLIHAAASSWSRLVARIAGVKIILENPERMYRNGPAVYLANHRSLFDMVIMHAAVNVQFRWLAKASLFRIPVWGWGMWGAGYIPVDRKNSRSAQASMHAAAERVKNGYSVVIFPEGTRGPTTGGDMLPFKKGAFILAKRAEVPVQPLTILDSDTIIPRTSKGLPPIRKGVVRVIVHEPMLVEEFVDLEVEELSSTVRSVIASAL